MRNRDEKEIDSPAVANPLVKLHLNSKDASSTFLSVSFINALDVC